MRKSNKRSLPLRIMIGMALGIFVGIVCHTFADPALLRTLLWIRTFEIGGNLFLNLFRMVVVPVVLVSMMIGTASMRNPALLGRVGIKTLLWFAATTVFSSFLGIFLARSFSIGAGVLIQPPENSSVKLSGSIHSLSETLSSMIPANVFQSFAEANMIQVIVIAIICGVALSKVHRHVPHLTKLLQEFDQLNMCVVDLILSLAPFGVFCLLAHTFSLFGIAVLLPLTKYVLCFLAASAVVLFIIYPLILVFAAHVSPWIFYRKMLPVILLALSTSSSNAVLPSNIETISFKVGVQKNVATFILSLGATINMNGTAIMQGCAAILIAQLYGVELTLIQILEIVAMSLVASIGTAGMPSAGVLMLGLVLQSVGLPLSGIALILGVDRIVDMFRTVVNITGDAVTAVAVGTSEKCLDRELFRAQNL